MESIVRWDSSYQACRSSNKDEPLTTGSMREPSVQNFLTTQFLAHPGCFDRLVINRGYC